MPTQQPGVLIVDENQIRGELYQHWLEGPPSTLTHSREEALDSLSKSHLVICFQGEMEKVTDFIETIRKRVPYVQLLQLTSRQIPFAVDRGYDDSLVEPFGKSELKETVQKLYRRALYDLKTHQYFQLSAALVATRRKGAVGTDEQKHVTSLKTEIEQVTREMKSLAAKMDTSDFDSLLRTMNIRSQYAAEPNHKPETDYSSKYHPRCCSGCGLDWGVQHGNDLGKGFKRIAAFVFECSRCQKVVKASAGEYDKIL